MIDGKSLTLLTAPIVAAQVGFCEISMTPGLPAPDKSQYTLFNPTPVDQRRPYNTDRPSKTDSPFTIDAGVFQIESDVASWTLDYENGERVRTWILSNSNFKLGLTNWMDLQVFPQLLRRHLSPSKNQSPWQ